MKKNLISASIGLGLMALAGAANANVVTFDEGLNLDFDKYFTVTLSAPPSGPPALWLMVSGLTSQFSTLSFSFNSGPTVWATHPFGDPGAWRASLFTSGLNIGTPYQLKVSGHTNGAIPGGHGTVTVQALGAVVAVPEPESYAMLLAGLGLLGLIARRRAKSA